MLGQSFQMTTTKAFHYSCICECHPGTEVCWSGGFPGRSSEVSWSGGFPGRSSEATSASDTL